MKVYQGNCHYGDFIFSLEIEALKDLHVVDRDCNTHYYNIQGEGRQSWILLYLWCLQAQQVWEGRRPVEKVKHQRLKRFGPSNRDLISEDDVSMDGTGERESTPGLRKMP